MAPTASCTRLLGGFIGAGACHAVAQDVRSFNVDAVPRSLHGPRRVLGQILDAIVRAQRLEMPQLVPSDVKGEPTH
jgi:hypothetical protein